MQVANCCKRSFLATRRLHCVARRSQIHRPFLSQILTPSLAKRSFSATSDRNIRTPSAAVSFMMAREKDTRAVVKGVVALGEMLKNRKKNACVDRLLFCVCVAALVDEVAAKGVSALLAAMRNHPNDVEV